MTTLAPPVVRGQEPTRSSGGRSGSVVWMALPAFVMFVFFGIVPLLGVIVLSFATWNGITPTIELTGLTSWRAALSNPSLPNAIWVTFLIMALSWLVQT